jgi:rhodanese-related sulfurtransferase
MFDNLQPEEFYAAYQKDENAVLLDVRRPDEFAAGHLPGAINLDFYRPDFADQVALLDKAKAYYVYCRSGARSANASNMMGSAQFTKVANMLGGILAWEGEIEQ